jgi:hypothetical protein
MTPGVASIYLIQEVSLWDQNQPAQLIIAFEMLLGQRHLEIRQLSIAVRGCSLTFLLTNTWEGS